MENGQFIAPCHNFSHWLCHHFVWIEGTCWYFCAIHGHRRYLWADGWDNC